MGEQFAKDRRGKRRGEAGADGLKLIAIAGTSGKTTTAWLTAAILAENGRRVGVLSSLGCLDGEAAVPVAASYEHPSDLAAWIGRLAESGCSHAVVEVSPRMLDRRAWAGIRCPLVAVTNLATGREAAAETEAVAAGIVGLLQSGGCLLTGTPSAPLEALRRRATRTVAGLECGSAGLRPTCDVTATPCERSLFGQTFLLRTAGQSVPVAVDPPTAPFVADAVLAAAVGVRCGVPVERIARGIESSGGVPGRTERLDRGQPVPVFLDAPSSGHGLAATLLSLRRMTVGRLAVLADERWVRRLGRGTFRRLAGRWCDASVVVPPSVLAEDAAESDVAAYARIDRLLSGLGEADCLLVLGGGEGADAGGGPDDGESAVARMVDGWMRLAHPARRGSGRRAA